MGVFSKLKNIFYDEVVVEDETQELDKVSKIVRKETASKDESPKVEELKFKTIEMPPVSEEKTKVEGETEDVSSDRALFRSERSFNFIDWDNEEEEEKLPPRKNVLDEPNSRVVRSTEPVKEESPRIFKPTPVISPIWGVLDKDYKKEEIKEKPVSNETFSSSVTEYDNVRRKAYGTLEDELEDTLNSMSKVTPKKIKEEVNKVDKDVDLLEQKTQKIEDLISKIEDATNDLDKTMSMSIGELEDKAAEANYQNEVAKEESVSDKTLTDSTLEHDLFNLIDSMYDDKEE